jgi:hypothetical protein
MGPSPFGRRDGGKLTAFHTARSSPHRSIISPPRPARLSLARHPTRDQFRANGRSPRRDSRSTARRSTGRHTERSASAPDAGWADAGLESGTAPQRALTSATVAAPRRAWNIANSPLTRCRDPRSAQSPLHDHPGPPHTSLLGPPRSAVPRAVTSHLVRAVIRRNRWASPRERASLVSADIASRRPPFQRLSFDHTSTDFRGPTPREPEKR